MTNQATELIVEHALRNEDNLRVAIQVGLAFAELRQRVVFGSLKALQADLQQAVDGDWAVEFDDQPWVSLRLRSWPEDMNLGVGTDRGDYRDNYFWMTRAGDSFGDPSLDTRLKSTLDAQIAAGKSHKNTVWYKYVDKVRHWGDEEGLVHLYPGPDAVEYREYLKTQLLSIQDAVCQVLP